MGKGQPGCALVCSLIHSFGQSSTGEPWGTSTVGDHVTEALVGRGQGVYSVLSFGAHSRGLPSVRTAESFKSGQESLLVLQDTLEVTRPEVQGTVVAILGPG